LKIYHLATPVSNAVTFGILTISGAVHHFLGRKIFLVESWEKFVLGPTEKKFKKFFIKVGFRKEL
jgi:hypothetical protein